MTFRSFVRSSATTGGWIAVFCLASSLALGAERPQTSFAGTALTAAAPRVPGAVLYDQTATLSPNSYTSQDFETANDAFDNQGADDFVIPAATTWSISLIYAPGAYFNGTGPTPNVNVWIYNDAAGAPGTAACSYPLLTPANYTDVAGVLTITLPSACTLGTGTYWLSVQSRMDFAVGGQWGWTGSTVQANALAKWRNPGNGFGSGCTAWGNLSTCIAGSTPDFGFRLEGAVVPVELQGFTIE